MIELSLPLGTSQAPLVKCIFINTSQNLTSKPSTKSSVNTTYTTTTHPTLMNSAPILPHNSALPSSFTCIGKDLKIVKQIKKQPHSHTLVDVTKTTHSKCCSDNTIPSAQQFYTIISLFFSPLIPKRARPKHTSYLPTCRSVFYHKFAI